MQEARDSTTVVFLGRVFLNECYFSIKKLSKGIAGLRR
jgi:hypothetical protein